MLDDLAANGYALDAGGRSTRVSITDAGRDALRAFASLDPTGTADDDR